MFKLDDIIDIGLEINQMRKVLKLWQGKRKEWAKPFLGFIDRNWTNLFWYKRCPEDGIESTNNGAEIINSLFKPHYKIMKHLENTDSTQNHFDTFLLRNNLRVFQRGKRKGYSPLQLEDVQTKITDWTELIWGENSEEAMRDIEASAVIGDLQDKRATEQSNRFGSISFSKTGREGGEIGLAREEMPFRIDREMRNAFVQCEN